MPLEQVQRSLYFWLCMFKYLGYPGTALYSRDVTNNVRLALDSGFTHIDTAQAYNNEDSVGVALASHFKTQPRSSLYITTKLFGLKPGETVRSVLSSQLKKLQVDYVDLYLWHTPIGFEGKLGGVWKQFEEIKQEGLAKSIGVSNFRSKDLEELLSSASVVPAVNQVRL